MTEVGTVNGTTDTDWAAFASAEQLTSTYANCRKTLDVVTAGGTTYQVTQYGYDAIGRLECSALRMNSATWGSLPASADARYDGSAGTGPDHANYVRRGGPGDRGTDRLWHDRSSG